MDWYLATKFQEFLSSEKGLVKQYSLMLTSHFCLILHIIFNKIHQIVQGKNL